MNKNYYINNMEFKNYQTYKDYVNEEWKNGYINELEQDKLIISLPETIGEDGFKLISNRHLTEEEFNNKFKNGK